jgi:hypothetical protein
MFVYQAGGHFISRPLLTSLERVRRSIQHKERVPRAGITPTEQERKPATVDVTQTMRQRGFSAEAEGEAAQKNFHRSKYKNEERQPRCLLCFAISRWHATLTQRRNKMEFDSRAALKTVSRLIEGADKNQMHSIFLNNRGEVDHVSVDRVNEDGEPVEVFLVEEQAAGGRPTFSILNILPEGIFLENTAEVVFIAEDETLLEAINYAAGERERFYSERAEEYGPSAWPN